LDSVDLLEVLGWTEEDRARLVVSSAIKRATLAMMKRNALLALASVARAARERGDSARAETIRMRAAETATDVREDEIVRAAARAVVAVSDRVPDSARHVPASARH
jgi:epoxyqueuosine reductase QueG